MHYAVPGGDVYLAPSACGCNPDEFRRPHQCTNASTLWVRLVPDAAPSLPPWVRVRSGSDIHRMSCREDRLETIAEFVQTIQS